MGTEKKHILEARIPKGQVPKVYARLAPTYDLWARLGEARARRRCLELAKIRDGESVLEVAVGTGLAFVEILKLNPTGQNEGIDLTEAMLSRAREKIDRLGLKNYRVSLGDAYDLKYSNCTFNVVVNNYMFDLLPEDDFPIVLGEFSRVLRPGGRLVMVNMTIAEHWYNTIWERIYRANPALFGGCRGVYLLPYLESAGFVETRRELINQLTFPSEVVYGVKLTNTKI